VTAADIGPEEIQAMRDWIADCQWAESMWWYEEWVEDLTDDEVVRAIGRHYEGGVAAFVAAM
jgi:hypothetical protein